MKRMRRTAAALLVPLTLIAGTALAQSSRTNTVQLTEEMRVQIEERSAQDADRTVRGLRSDGPPGRSMMIRAWEVGDGAQLGIGRFSAGEIARPRTHMERHLNSTSVRARETGIAAVGLSVRF